MEGRLPLRRSAALEQPLRGLEAAEEDESSCDSSDDGDSGDSDSPPAAGAGGRGKGKSKAPPPFPGGPCPGASSSLARGGKKSKRSAK